MPDEPTYELPEDLTFEQAVERLEEIVDTLESDGFALEEALEAHAEGVALARFCMKRLEKAELRIEQLSIQND